MTEQQSVLQDDRYIPVHNAGFVGLIDVMGNDSAIVQAARVSYGTGTKSSREDRALIRYLMSMDHTSPFEMVEFKFHIKLPIFVMRQHIRHRTANVNEYSGRYSEMSNEFYFPEPSYLMKQSTSNKQGRAGELNHEESNMILNLMHKVCEASYNGYMYLLENYGLARELSRLIMPVSNYTECYWKIDLKNLLHYFSLRRDGHAQREIRDFADAMFKLVKPYVPFTIEAWEDYKFYGYRMSRMELAALHEILDFFDNPPIKEEELINQFSMNEREAKSFIAKFFTK